MEPYPPLSTVYFFILTGVNILNLILFKTSTIAAQSSAASLGQAVTMIMSQHIILSLHDWRSVSSGGGHDTSRNPTSVHELGPMSYANHYPGGPSVHASNARRAGTTAGSQPTTVLQLGNNNNNGRRSSRHAGNNNGSRSFMKDFVRSKRSSEDDVDNDVNGAPLEIRVQVDEEVKLDYDAMYPDESRDHKDPVSRPFLHLFFFFTFARTSCVTGTRLAGLPGNNLLAETYGPLYVGFSSS